MAANTRRSPKKLNAALKGVLPWRISISKEPIARRITYRPGKPVLIYTDATGTGRVSSVLYPENERMVVSAHMPAWFMQIAKFVELGKAGEILGVLRPRELQPAQHIVLCCDNRGADGAIIRGSCKTRHGRQLASVLWLILDRLRIPIWAEWAASDFNPADPPPRICRLLPTPWVLKEEALCPAREFANISPSTTKLAAAQFS